MCVWSVAEELQKTTFLRLMKRIEKKENEINATFWSSLFVIFDPTRCPMHNRSKKSTNPVPIVGPVFGPMPQSIGTR